MTATRNPPAREVSGITQARDFQPLGNWGMADQTWGIYFHDEFLPYQAGTYTVTANTNGTAAVTPYDGGAVLLTTNSATPLATDIASLQLNAAILQLSTSARWFFGCRFSLGDATNSAWNCGLIQTTTSPFTVTDGIYFNKASGNTYPTLSLVSGSAVQGTVDLSSILTMANATAYDLAFAYDGYSDVLIWAGTGIFGAVPDQDRITLGPQARLSGVGSLTLSTVILNPTLALQSGTPTSKTATVDFQYAAKAR